MRRPTLLFAAAAILAGCEGHTSNIGSEPPADARGKPGSEVRIQPQTRAEDRAATAASGTVPVVVELFSSEGCSSCPPADKVLDDLATTQPIDGVDVIALEMHVDYWNDLGWTDPFSDARFSERQRSYARVGNRSGVFTPEAIVDGASSIIGSDRGALSAAITRARDRAHVTVALTGTGSAVQVTLGDLDAVTPASLWIAVTESGLETAVPSGENSGRTLRHAPVVRALERAGDARAGVTPIVVPRVSVRKGPLSAVVFVQREDRAIVGAGRIALAAE